MERRHGYFNSDTDSDANGNTDRNSDGYSDSYTNCDSFADADGANECSALNKRGLCLGIICIFEQLCGRISQ